MKSLAGMRVADSSVGVGPAVPALGADTEEVLKKIAKKI